MTIERSTGISVPGWAGPLPGGGYFGDTQELDDAVRACAELLQGALGKDVVIRFNSHRESGGAWIKDDEHRNAGIGLGASYRYDGEYPNKHKTDIIVFDVYMDEDFATSTNRDTTEHSYYSESFDVIEKALEALLKNLKEMP